ncbi:MAG: protein BatD [Proteobacteria bacterium]|nr:protein BatD [Pseudomonadota bacterium]
MSSGAWAFRSARRARARGSRVVGAAAALALLCLAAAGALAQGVSLRLTADRHITAVGEPVVVTVELAVEGRADVEFLEPTLRGWRLLSNSLVSRNIELINWQMRRRETRVYEVAALQAGTLALGPAGVRLAQRVVRSNTVQVEVRPAGANTPAGAPAALPTPSASARGGAQSGGFIVAQPSLTRVYVGQQLVVTWRLYTQSELLSFGIETRPTTDGFWSEDAGSPRRLDLERVVLDGQVYGTALLQRSVLFPQRAGSLPIGPFEAQLQTADTLGEGPLLRRADGLTIEVLALPAAGRPAGFADANVGHFALAALVDREAVEVGQAVTLRLIARGSGNLRQLVLPVLPALAGVRAFEPKLTDRLEAGEAGLQGEKEVAYLLLPQQPGELRIPALALAYFDPEARAYRVAQTKPLRLRVTGQAAAASRGAPSAQPASNVLGPDIRPPRPAEALQDRLPRAPINALYLGLAALPLLLLALGWGAERVQAARSAPTTRARQRAMQRRVRTGLRQARAAAAQGRPAAEASALLVAALHEQLDHRLGLRAGGLTREALAQALRGQGVGDELAAAVGALLDQCDQARFAPGAAPQALGVATVDAAEAVIRALAAGTAAAGASRDPRDEERS